MKKTNNKNLKARAKAAGGAAVYMGVVVAGTVLQGAALALGALAVYDWRCHNNLKKLEKTGLLEEDDDDMDIIDLEKEEQSDEQTEDEKK